MATYKTPGVYIEEKNAFPNSVVAVETAVPAFIGYTEKAMKLGKTAINKPVRITSLVEFEQIFGGPPEYKFSVSPVEDPAEGEPPETETFPLTVVDEEGNPTTKEHKVEWDKKSMYRLYNCIRMFYQNGGGNCWIVSVGTYDKEVQKDALTAALKPLADEPEPTMVLSPDTLVLEAGDCHSVYMAILDHCQSMMSRIGIFDVHGADKDTEFDQSEIIEDFRTGIGTNYLNYGVAYYPWLETNVVSDREITFMNFMNEDSTSTLTDVLKGIDEDAQKALERALKTKLMEKDDEVEEGAVDENGDPAEPKFKKGQYEVVVEELGEEKDDKGNRKPVESTKYVNEPGVTSIDMGLRSKIPVYKGTIIKEAVKKVNLIPPASAMAGVYTAVDNSRGVWKAPANWSLNSVLAPRNKVNNDLNDRMNMPLNGKAVNPIREFPGQGSIVWGARTLDGNSQDWRYINVRRTMIFLEMSVKAAARAYVFEPNDANTWVMVQSMISNFLNNVWKAGGLFGSTPGEAYDVQVGLGTTMTANDILDGYMNITVRVAVVRPAEFIVITFQQKMAEA